MPPMLCYTDSWLIHKFFESFQFDTLSKLEISKISLCATAINTISQLVLQSSLHARNVKITDKASKKCLMQQLINFVKPLAILQLVDQAKENKEDDVIFYAVAEAYLTFLKSNVNICDLQRLADQCLLNVRALCSLAKKYPTSVLVCPATRGRSLQFSVPGLYWQFRAEEKVDIVVIVQNQSEKGLGSQKKRQIEQCFYDFCGNLDTSKSNQETMFMLKFKLSTLFDFLWNCAIGGQIAWACEESDKLFQIFVNVQTLSILIWLPRCWIIDERKILKKRIYHACYEMQVEFNGKY